MKKTVTCIVCPNGCRIDCSLGADGAFVCAGNACKRGAIYAQTELTHPMRTLTTTVKTNVPQMPALPVRTNGEIPKSSICDAIRVLSGVTAAAPKSIGDVIVSNLLGTGCDVIATADLKAELS